MLRFWLKVYGATLPKWPLLKRYLYFAIDPVMEFNIGSQSTLINDVII